jgi:hypothetical protein
MPSGRIHGEGGGGGGGDGGGRVILEYMLVVERLTGNLLRA